MIDDPNDRDELLRAAAREYNVPGETPRERMWESIRAERVQRAPARARPAPWRRFVLPAVAAALLVVGVAIGRLYERMRSTPSSTHNLATTAATVDTITSQASAEPTRTVAPQLRRGNGDRAAQPAPEEQRVDSRTMSPAPRVPSMAFRLAVVEHLAGTEAMLTSFRDEAARGNVDAQITSWARNLLTTTRLLQTAAAQQDPTMKRLLDDLELVLVQIAQYSSTGPHRAEELELIQHSIERRGVIGKLRTTLPARLAPSGT